MSLTKEEIKSKEADLIQLTDSFCNEKLNEEYAYLCRKLVKKMGRKRDVPFITGKLNVWAAAVIQAIGSINFLFNKSSTPYASVNDICNFFEVKKGTVSGRVTQLNKLFKLSYFSDEFRIKDMLNPLDMFKQLFQGFIPEELLPDDLKKLVEETRAQGGQIRFRIV